MKHSTILRLGWLAALLTLPGSVPTHATSSGTSSSARVALVIGNNAYKGVPTLARAMSPPGGAQIVPAQYRETGPDGRPSVAP
jgi:hypothetical protein